MSCCDSDRDSDSDSGSARDSRVIECGSEGVRSSLRYFTNQIMLQHYVLTLVALLITVHSAVAQTHIHSHTGSSRVHQASHDYTDATETGNYSCTQLKKWIKIEKHYSNIRKEGFFDELDPKQCLKNPALQLLFSKYTYGKDEKKELKKAFSPIDNTKKDQKCKVHDEYAIMYMSSYSINHNFSHFLHSLLRLFCALLDAQFIVWNQISQKFEARVPYVIWMDENVKLGKNEMIWMQMMGSTIRHVKDYKKGDCFSSNQLVYGSGCAKLLPPEKWYGYPGCRANKVLPAFAHFIRAQTEANMVLQTVQAPVSFWWCILFSYMSHLCICSSNVRRPPCIIYCISIIYIIGRCLLSVVILIKTSILFSLYEKWVLLLE